MTKNPNISTAANGYLAPGQEPSSPVEWTLLNRGRPLEVGETEVVLFEANTSGFDSFGLEVSAGNIATIDTLEVYVKTPAGAVVQTFTISGTSGPIFATASTAAIQSLWPRYAVTAKVTSTGTATATVVNAVMYLRRSSRDG